MTDDVETLKALARVNMQAQLTDAADRVKIQAGIADRALQSMLFVHGGAMVALFTFVGNAASRPAPALRLDAGRLHVAFGCFAVGLFLALAAHLCAFWSQDRFYLVAFLEARRFERIAATGQPDDDQAAADHALAAGGKAYVFGLLVIAISMVLFVAGAWWALAGVLI